MQLDTWFSSSDTWNGEERRGEERIVGEMKVRRGEVRWSVNKTLYIIIILHFHFLILLRMYGPYHITALPTTTTLQNINIRLKIPHNLILHSFRPLGFGSTHSATIIVDTGTGIDSSHCLIESTTGLAMATWTPCCWATCSWTSREDSNDIYMLFFQWLLQHWESVFLPSRLARSCT